MTPRHRQPPCGQAMPPRPQLTRPCPWMTRHPTLSRVGSQTAPLSADCAPGCWRRQLRPPCHRS
eukprot:11201543-Lingulodinium_polyedra.AAC.1